MSLRFTIVEPLPKRILEPADAGREEVVRLESHVERMSSRLDKGGELGRQLDFLVQEMFREGNTIGSKCNDAKVAHMVVDLKTHIERMREQVQNIE